MNVVKAYDEKVLIISHLNSFSGEYGVEFSVGPDVAYGNLVDGEYEIQWSRWGDEADNIEKLINGGIKTIILKKNYK